MGRRLFVGNLPFDTTSEQLSQLFGQVGACPSADVVTDRATGRSRGFGFVEMGSDDEARRAITQFNGYELLGRRLNVDEAHERAAAGARDAFQYAGGGGERRRRAY